MAKVFIPQACAKEGVDYLLQQGYEVEAGSDSSTRAMMEGVAECDAMLLRTAPCPETVLAAGRKLKVVARHGVGYDNIDVAAASRLGIWVTNTPQALSDSVAEYTLTALLIAAKNLMECSREMYKGNYSYKNTHKGLDLCGKTLGVVGFGRIGGAVAKKAHFGLDMNILAYDPFRKGVRVPEYVRPCSWKELFSQADSRFTCPAGRPTAMWFLPENLRG